MDDLFYSRASVITIMGFLALVVFTCILAAIIGCHASMKLTPVDTGPIHTSIDRYYSTHPMHAGFRGSFYDSCADFAGAHPGFEFIAADVLSERRDDSLNQETPHYYVFLLEVIDNKFEMIEKYGAR